MSYNPQIISNTFTAPITTAGKKAAYVTKTANYTAVVTDEYIKVPTAGVTITLPDASTVGKMTLNIKNTSTGIVTVAAAASGQTIDGSNTYALNIQYQAITFISDGVSDWGIF